MVKVASVARLVHILLTRRTEDSVLKRPEIGGLGGAIYLSYLVLRHTILMLVNSERNGNCSGTRSLVYCNHKVKKSIWIGIGYF